MTSELLVADLDLPAAGEAAAGQAAQLWTLNRPDARNALDPALVAALSDALRAAEDTGIHVVVIAGSGRSFCAGADLRFLQSHDASNGETPRRLLEGIWNLTLAIEESPITFVAALHGHAVAGGLELALACDVVIATADTLVGDGHVMQNLLPGGGASARLERAVGRGPSSWLALTGELLPATDHAFAGWLKAVVPAEELAASYCAVAQKLAQSSPVARAQFKRLLHRRYAAPTAADREAELDTFDQHWIDQNVPEALRLFLIRNRKAS